MTKEINNDLVYMLHSPKHGFIYCIDNSPANVWRKVIREEIMGTGITQEILKERGYRAKKVHLAVW